MKKLKTWLRKIWPISQEKFEQKVEADCLFQTNVFDEIKTLDSNISEKTHRENCFRGRKSGKETRTISKGY